MAEMEEKRVHATIGVKRRKTDPLGRGVMRW